MCYLFDMFGFLNVIYRCEKYIVLVRLLRLKTNMLYNGEKLKPHENQFEIIRILLKV